MAQAQAAQQRKRVFVREVSSSYGTRAYLEELRRWPRVRTVASIPWERGPRAYNKWLVTPRRDPVQSLEMHIESYAPGARSERHGHQNEAAFYILEGRGYEVHDGRRYEWQAGDLVIVHSSCTHQHFNLSGEAPFTVLVFKTKPVHLLHHLLFQRELEPLPQEPDVGYRPDDTFPKEEARFWRQGDREATYYQDDLAGKPLTLRRRRDPTAMRKVIHPADMPWENSPQGRLKHMVNERLCHDLDVPVVSVDAYQQEIPPGSRSGRHRHMSEEFLLVLEGRGYDLHWDVDLELTDDGYRWQVAGTPTRHEWQAGDLIYVPINSVHQHFNASPAAPARLISMTSRIYTFLGYGQFALEQYENAPGYRG